MITIFDGLSFLFPQFSVLVQNIVYHLGNREFERFEALDERLKQGEGGYGFFCEPGICREQFSV